MGLGRHALWLARRGWQVSAVEISDVALEKMRLAALQLNVKLDLHAMDASDYKFEPMRFDLIVLFYRVDRCLFPKIIASLSGGGLLILKARLRRETIPGTTPVTTDPLDKDELLPLASRFASHVSQGTIGTRARRRRVCREEVGPVSRYSTIRRKDSQTLVVDTIGVGLAAFGFLNPLLVAFIHVSSEMAFILNSARLLPRMSSANKLVRGFFSEAPTVTH